LTSKFDKRNHIHISARVCNLNLNEPVKYQSLWGHLGRFAAYPPPGASCQTPVVGSYTIAIAVDAIRRFANRPTSAAGQSQVANTDNGLDSGPGFGNSRFFYAYAIMDVIVMAQSNKIKRRAYPFQPIC